jgi:hypothetical protein
MATERGIFDPETSSRGLYNTDVSKGGVYDREMARASLPAAAKVSFSIAATMATIVALWPAPLEPVLQRPNNARVQIVTLTLPTGDQPRPQKPFLATTLEHANLAWQADWSAQRAPIRVTPSATSQPQPQGPLSVVELDQANRSWQQDWPTQVLTKCAAWYVPPVVSTYVPPGVAMPAALWLQPPDPQPQQKRLSIVPTFPQADQPPVQGQQPALKQQLATSWPIDVGPQTPAPANVPVKIAPLQIGSGASQPIPQAPLSATELAQTILSWQVDWPAQTGPKCADWNVPVIPPSVPAPPMPMHVYLASQPPDPPPVQRLRSIVPTLTFGDQPIPQAPLSVTELAQFNAAWQVSWGTQQAPISTAWLTQVPAQPYVPMAPHVYAASLPPDPQPRQLFRSIVPTFAAVSQPVPTAPFSRAILSQILVVWQPPDPMPVQRIKSVVPTLVFGAQPVPRGPMPAWLRTHVAVLWTPTWPAQSYAPNAGWNTYQPHARVLAEVLTWTTARPELLTSTTARSEWLTSITARPEVTSFDSES